MNYYKGIPATLYYVAIYTLAPVLIATLGILPQYAVIIQLPVLFLLFKEVLFRPHKVTNMFTTNSANILFGLYILLCIIMFLRGYNIDERGVDLNFNGKLYVMFGNGLYILWTLVPLVVKRTYPYFQLKQFCKYGIYVCAIFSIVTIFNLPKLVTSSLLMAAGVGGDDSCHYARVAEIFSPLMLCLAYISKKEKLVYFVCFALNLLVLVLMARRGALMMNCMLVVFMLITNYRNINLGMRILTIILSILVVTMGSSFLSNSDFFSYLFVRGLDDTREGVNQALLEQMSPMEMVFGKGLNGSYYYPIKVDDMNDGWRYGCETGFLNIVLKGGFLMAIVYILTLLIISIKGIFKSKNRFCKGGGFYILWSLIYLYPFGVLDFNISFFFIWMWAMLCSRSEIRQMSDHEIQKRYFNS